MKILYVSAMIDNISYNLLFTKKNKPMHAANKYHTLLCKGLCGNGAQVYGYSVLPVSGINYDKLIAGAKPQSMGGFTNHYIGVLNIPVVKNFCVFTKAFFKALSDNRQTVVMCDVLTVSASLGAALGAKASRKKCIGIVTDLPEFQNVSKHKFMLSINRMIFSLVNGYVFLTADMNEAVNKKNKPYLVLEGHVDSEMINKQHSDFREDKKNIVYAGSLKQIYGIDKLCSAFLSCAKDGEELHIYGAGDYEEKLKSICKENPSVVFHGNCPNDEVIEAELNAALLVNPRPTSGEYTKYSFPSKTLEYMVSGTPVLTSKLAGIPAEYDKYLYYFDDTDPDSLSLTVRDVLDKPLSELRQFGADAREFVLKEKNNISRAAKIIELVSELTGRAQ